MKSVSESVFVSARMSEAILKRVDLFVLDLLLFLIGTSVDGKNRA